MMRGIKFRAWCNNMKSIVDVMDIHFSKTNSYIKTPDGGFSKNFTLMQYTGLKDKNGNEIYESDLVECCIDSECSMHQIVWGGETNNSHYPAFDLAPYVEVESNGISYFSEAGTIEVVGNIYED